MIPPAQFAAYRAGYWYLVTVPPLHAGPLWVEKINPARIPEAMRQFPVDLDRLDALTGLPIVPGRHDG